MLLNEVQQKVEDMQDLQQGVAQLTKAGTRDAANQARRHAPAAGNRSMTLGMDHNQRLRLFFLP